jgi:adenine-specific DNA-methyltransferase
LLKNLLGTNAFDFPKSVYAIKDSLKITLPKNGICLDFFAGSGTTFQAVAELNEEDGGTRQCILVTNNESNICRDVTWERVKRVTTGTHDYPECTKKYDGNQSAHAAFYTMEVKKL